MSTTRTPEVLMGIVMAETNEKEIREPIDSNAGEQAFIKNTGEESGGAQEWPHYQGGGRREYPPCNDDCDLWFYRDRTVALLKRYARMAVETGRLPSLLGRECFRARLTPYAMASFEDMAIFVHDVEMALGHLHEFHQQLIALAVLEEYSLPEVTHLLRRPLRTVEREFPEALDDLSRVFLGSGLMVGENLSRG